MNKFYKTGTEYIHREYWVILSTFKTLFDANIVHFVQTYAIESG